MSVAIEFNEIGVQSGEVRIEPVQKGTVTERFGSFLARAKLNLQIDTSGMSFDVIRNTHGNNVPDENSDCVGSRLSFGYVQKMEGRLAKDTGKI